jgi:Flp pilus assembly protein TadD
LAEASRLEGLQRYSDAEAVLRPAARGVSAVPARSALVRVLVLQGKGVQAEEEARQLVKVEPRSPEANGYLALALACQKRMDDATQTLAEAVRLGLRHGRYHAWLVRIAQTEKLKVSLGELFQGGLALEPDSPELLLELCKYQYQMGKFKEALQAAEGLLRRSPTDAIALYLKGLVLLQQQQTAGAIASLEASLKAQPNQPQTQKLLAQLKSQSVPPNWKR